MPGFTRKTNSAAVAFMIAGAAWLVVGTLYGLIAAIHLAAPEFFNNIFFLVFGRTRPIHVNTVALRLRGLDAVRLRAVHRPGAAADARSGRSGSAGSASASGRWPCSAGR